MDNLEIATLGAGCFWCVEAVFQDLKGVKSVVSGYTGGETDHPTYKDICTGLTGHAEVAKITYDSSIISFEDLLKVFWTTHDPTTLNQQGADKGTQYRSAIYYHNAEQKEIALQSKQDFAPQLWNDPIVTEITEAPIFYSAEAKHQNFYKDNLNYGYCRVVINPKVAKVKEKFAHLLKSYA